MLELHTSVFVPSALFPAFARLLKAEVMAGSAESSFCGERLHATGILDLFATHVDVL